VEIVIHSHHATVSDHLRRAAQRGIEKVARRLTRTVDAVVRFEQDGPLRRVEIVLHAARSRRIVAEATGRYFGPALAAALARAATKTNHLKRPPKDRARAARRAPRRARGT
jgi:ribosome-associated translation inhibitor RaiA